MTNKTNLSKILAAVVLINLAAPAQAFSWSWVTTAVSNIKQRSTALISTIKEHKFLAGALALTGAAALVTCLYDNTAPNTIKNTNPKPNSTLDRLNKWNRFIKENGPYPQQITIDYLDSSLTQAFYNDNTHKIYIESIYIDLLIDVTANLIYTNDIKTGERLVWSNDDDVVTDIKQLFEDAITIFNTNNTNCFPKEFQDDVKNKISEWQQKILEKILNDTLTEFNRTEPIENQQTNEARLKKQQFHERKWNCLKKRYVDNVDNEERQHIIYFLSTDNNFATLIVGDQDKVYTYDMQNKKLITGTLSGNYIKNNDDGKQLKKTQV